MIRSVDDYESDIEYKKVNDERNYKYKNVNFLPFDIQRFKVLRKNRGPFLSADVPFLINDLLKFSQASLFIEDRWLNYT